jgi:hypothetical protein
MMRAARTRRRRRVANNIRDWVVTLSYLVDLSSKNALLRSAKETTDALNKETAKQTEAARKSEAERIAGAMRVNAFLAGAEKKQIQAITANSTQVTQFLNAASQKQLQNTVVAGQKQSQAVAIAAKNQTSSQIEHAVRSGNALALYRAAQIQGYAQMARDVGTSLRNFAGHVTTTTTTAGNAVRNFGSVVSTVSSATRPFFMAVGGAALSVGTNVGILTNQLDKLYNLAKRTGSSPADIRALRQSLSMMGGSPEEADAMITSASNALLQRGNQGFLKGIGIDPNHPQGTVGILEDFSKFIRQMPTDIAQQYGNVIGISPDMIRYLQSGDFAKQMRINRDVLKEFEKEELQSMIAGKKLADQWRTLMFGAGIQNRSLFRTIIEESGEALKTFNTWLKANATDVASSVRVFTKEATAGIIRLLDYFKEVFADTPEGAKLRAEWAKWFNDRLKDAIALKNAFISIADSLIKIVGLLGIPYNAGKDAKANALKKRRDEGETLSPEDEQRIKEADERGGLITKGGEIGRWLREKLFGVLIGPAAANEDASKDFKEGVGKFDKAVDKLTGGPMGGPGGAAAGGAPGGGEGGFWSGIKGAFAGRPAALGGTGEGIGAGFQRGYSGGGAGKAGSDGVRGSPQAPELTSEQRGLLQGLAAGEQGPHGYKAINYAAGGGAFTGNEHPFEGQKGVTAAGRYQMLATNWGNARAALGLKGGFTPENQDRAALWLARKDYKTRTGRDLDADLKDPARLANIGQVLTPTWHGIPGNFADIVRKGGAPGAAEVKKSEFVNELQSGIRNKPISDQLRGVFDAAGKQTGLIADIVSGGQDPHGPRRTGSRRHDVGEGRMGAADLKLRDAKTGQIMDLRNPEHRKRIAGYVAAARAGGATGMGAGLEYMGPNTLHIGGGKDNSWGSEAGFLAQAKEQQQPGILDRIKSTAGNVAKGVSDIVIPEAKSAAKGFNPERFDAVKTSGDFANPGRYIGPSQTTDNSKKIDFDAIYNTSIHTNEPRQAASAMTRAHEQLNSMHQRQLQGMWR